MPYLVVLFLLLASPVFAQQSGRVVTVEAQYVSTPEGDQKIVSTVTVQSGTDFLSAEVEGGTIDDVTLTVSHESVPKRGDLIWLEKRGKKWKIVEVAQDFVTYGKWPTSNMNWLLNPQNEEGLPTTGVQTDMVGAANAWPLQSSANFTMTLSALTSTTVQANDGVNQVFFRPTANPNSPNALASTYCWTNTGILKDCDAIVWGGAAQWFLSSTGCSAGAYVLDVMTHEYGHIAGLQHGTVAGATMTPGYSGCSTTQRSLEADDIAGILSLYPAVEPPPPPPPPGEVSPNGTRGVTITDAQLDVWTFGTGANGKGYPVLRDGVAMGQRGVEYVWWNGVVYVRNGQNRWVKWTGTQWANVASDPML